ncbi:MAG: hypothetical protein M3R57_09230 [Chloroflexota bacterium]|nr:hypothetical protein [Chloroflexota bacterium]
MHRFAHRKALLLPLAVSGAVVLLAALAGPSIAIDKWVTTYDMKYLPGVVTINAGDKVTWVNDDDVPHDAAGRGWSTPLLNNGDSHSIQFTKAGTYRYSCTIHPEMRSAVSVRSAGGGTRTAPPADMAPESQTPPTGDAMPAVLAILAATITAFGLVLRRERRPRA